MHGPALRGMSEHDPSNDRWISSRRSQGGSRFGDRARIHVRARVRGLPRHGSRAAHDHAQRPQEDASDDDSRPSRHPRRHVMKLLDALEPLEGRPRPESYEQPIKTADPLARLTGCHAVIVCRTR